MNRRTFLGSTLGAFAAVTPLGVQAQQGQQPPAPRDWSGQSPAPYPDPDIVALDPRFNRYFVRNTPIRRLYTGTLWAEGPAWNGVGRYLVWSDIPNNVQMRLLEEDGHVTTFRSPSGYSNGNTFDFQGRQLSSEHGGRRVVRYEPGGSVTVVAERYQGKRLNSPNDVVVHPDGSCGSPIRCTASPATTKDSKLIRSCRWRCTGWTLRTARSKRSATSRPGPTDSASHRITSCCTWPTRVPRER